MLGHLHHHQQPLCKCLLDLGDLQVGVRGPAFVPVHAPVERRPGGRQRQLVGDEPRDVTHQGVVVGEGQYELRKHLVRVQRDGALADVLHH